MENINDLEFNIIYSARKTISIEIKPEGILVRAPKGMSRREINTFVLEKRTWIEKHLPKMQERKAALEQLSLFTMEEINYLADKALVVIPEKVRKYAPQIALLTEELPFGISVPDGEAVLAKEI